MPTEPHKSAHVTVHKVQNSFHKRLVELFEKRPVWSRLLLQHQWLDPVAKNVRLGGERFEENIQTPVQPLSRLGLGAHS